MAIEPGLNPQFPVVEGDLPLTTRWQLTLPQAFNSRVDDGNLVLWRPGLTIWLNAFGTEDGMGIPERLKRDRENASGKSFGFEESVTGPVHHLVYRIDNEEGAEARHSLFTFAHAEDGQIMSAMYFDDEGELASARAIAGSIRLR